MRRRDFIGLVGGAVACWPLALHVFDNRSGKVADVVMGNVRSSFYQADCVQSLDRPSACISHIRGLGFSSGSRLADQHHAGDAGAIKNQD